ncbi:MAG: DUF6261 family protein [Chitinophagaceae bacterium]
MIINSIDLKSLRNAENIQFTNDFLNLVQLNDENVLKCKPQYDALKAIQTDIENLFKIDKGSNITPIIEELDAKRDNAVMGIFKLIDAFKHHFDVAKNTAALQLQDALKVYGSATEINYSSLPAETATLKSMLTDVTTKPNLTAAVSELGLTNWFVELGNINEALAQKYLERTLEIGGANPNSLRDKRTEATQLYNNLKNMLLAQATVANFAAPFAKTINELNALIDQYNLIITRRETNGNQKIDESAQPK